MGNQEIERKFLVLNENYKDEAYSSSKITQGYISSDPERNVRIRLDGDVGYLTIKGKSNETGVSRFEWETKIEYTDALELIKLCESSFIEKIRHKVKVGNHIYEVDEFLVENEGLVVAEIELNSEDEIFEKPSWLGKEVTGDNRYYNSNIIRFPYTKNWKSL